MYASLYEDGFDSINDSYIIVGIVDEAVQNPELAIVAHFMRDGCMIMLLLVGHNASWFISWSVSRPDVLDTGISTPLSLSDPELEHQLAVHIAEITETMIQSCECHRCGRGDSE